LQHYSVIHKFSLQTVFFLGTTTVSLQPINSTGSTALSTEEVSTSSFAELEQAKEKTEEQINQTRIELAMANEEKEKLENLTTVLSDVQRYVSNLIASRRLIRSVPVTENCSTLISYLDELQAFLGFANFSLALEYALAINSSRVTLCKKDELSKLADKKLFIEDSIKKVQNQTSQVNK